MHGIGTHMTLLQEHPHNRSVGVQALVSVLWDNGQIYIGLGEKRKESLKKERE